MRLTRALMMSKKEHLPMQVESTDLSLESSSRLHRSLTHGDVRRRPCEEESAFWSQVPEDDLEASEGEDDDLDEDKILPEDTEHVRTIHALDESRHPHHAWKKAPRSVIVVGVESFKYLYSSVLLTFSVVLVTTAIFAKQTLSTREKKIPPIVAFITLWCLIVWLAFAEGAPVCLVGLRPFRNALYAQSHPCTLKCTALAHNSDNLERFIVGRQFLVVAMIFLINYISTTVPDAQILGLSKITHAVFLQSGLAIILITTIMGQLLGLVNARKCMIDFMNNPFMLFTTYVALAIEKSGLMHSVYLIQIFFSKISGTPIASDERVRTTFQKVFFWGRVCMSSIILLFSLTVTLKAMLDRKTLTWQGVPSYGSVILFFALIGLNGIFDGIETAISAVATLPDDQLARHTIVWNNCKRAFVGKKLKAFWFGRQISMTACMISLARITTLNYSRTDSRHIDGLPSCMESIFDAGFLGALMTSIFSSLAFRIMSSTFPFLFLSNPFVYLVIRVCLALQKIGVCSSARVMARYHKLLVGYQPDSVYLEGAEKHGTKPVTRRDKDIDRLISILKLMYSMALLLFSITLAMTSNFKSKSRATIDIHVPPVAVLFIFWFLIAWLGMMEGERCALIGLQPIDKSRYVDSHPRSYLCMSLLCRGDNMEHFNVGRQLLVVIVIFMIHSLGTFSSNGRAWGLPNSTDEIFLSNGVAVTLVTIILGQLTAQSIAASCKLDFMNN